MHQTLPDIEILIKLVKQTKQFVENREMADCVKVKGLADYVTQVDVGIQNFLKEKLSKLAPEIQFLGEEEGLHEMSCSTFWILDPIDGTTNLIHGYLHSVVSLGLCHEGEMVLGIIYDPFREEVFYAEKGKGSYLNGKPIHVSDAESLCQTMIGAGTAPYNRELATENFARIQRVYEASQDIRRTGSAAMDFAYTACGRQGGYFEVVLQPWDFAAGMIIIEEAGGMITDFEGKPLNPQKAGCVAASNGKVHQELLELM